MARMHTWAGVSFTDASKALQQCRKHAVDGGIPSLGCRLVHAAAAECRWMPLQKSSKENSVAICLSEGNLTGFLRYKILRLRDADAQLLPTPIVSPESPRLAIAGLLLWKILGFNVRLTPCATLLCLPF